MFTNVLIRVNKKILTPTRFKCGCAMSMLTHDRRLRPPRGAGVISKQTANRDYSTVDIRQELGAVHKIVIPNKFEEYLQASCPETASLMQKDLLIYNDFVSQEEEQSLLNEIQPYMKRLRYEYDHWDNAIHGYRETERKHWTGRNQEILQRVRDVAFPPGTSPMSFIHILDLAKTGFIKPHVDAVRFCGDTVAGLSLMSSSVMRYTHKTNESSYADVLLRQRSLYVMRGSARYDFTHELFADEFSKFNGDHIPRDRRISVICRNEPA